MLQLMRVSCDPETKAPHHISSDLRVQICKDGSTPLHLVKDPASNLETVSLEGKLCQEAGTATMCPSGQFLFAAPLPYPWFR